MKKNKLSKFLAAFMAVFILASFPVSALAAKGDQGTDLSRYQGYTAVKGYASDKFSISQMGGDVNGAIYDQDTYSSQVSTGIAQGLRMHTYIWDQGVVTYAEADRMLDYFLPRVQTPKGSIVALDVEAGAQNTAVIDHSLQRIKNAGYTPVLYGYKNFLQTNTDLVYLSSKYVLWLAEYPNYGVTPYPNFNYFPSWNNIGLFQFSSTYVAGGLDGNIDLTGITDNGYTKHDNPKTNTPAVEAGKQADDTPKKAITNDFTVKVNFGATRWATGQAIPNWVKGNSYKVIQTSGNRVLLDGILSWIDRSDVEILATNQAQPASPQASNVYTVQYGDSLSAIAAKFNTSVWALQSANGIQNANFIMVGQQLRVNGGQSQQATSAQRVVYAEPGDSYWLVAQQLGVSWTYLMSKNGANQYSGMRVGQTIYY
ncbi:GH25 family lysozyme [Furfurilactobacillus siliginis]|uniref:1,4-beta-N-acetylmuramidase n=1 Tax=Furfurilactobacillus siliginis TaxID=348151 RepID=A0A0R2L571_9LACO|nr:GH25 family lysozyme [Furfurilactobacillus siliginis]KRN96862.1 phage lysin [Furfurilactobacillus siliginis]GEK28530.1 1,4-beta-N-acetylmuramidase [Furfurilactobacillus siliginis]